MSDKRFIDLAAPGVRVLQPYLPGKPIEELQRELGLAQVIKLASNENPLGPSSRVREVLSREIPQLGRYPDGNGFVLKQAIAKHLKVELNQITLGNGSNDVLELAARAFVSASDEVIFSQYAFAVYPIVTQAVNAKAVVTPANRWGHDLAAMKAAITEKTKLVFIANPNNPTGTCLNGEALENFVAAVPGNIIVVIDEAYYEYARDLKGKDYLDSLAWMKRYLNIVITRTFSKAYGLAGLRVGYCVSNPQIADVLNRVRQPFNVNHLAIMAAAAALEDQTFIAESVKLNRDGLRQLSEAFTALGLEFIPSAGNFISVRIGANAAEVYSELLKKGIIVRPVANYAMPEHLRVTVGNEQENLQFLQALQAVLA